MWKLNYTGTRATGSRRNYTTVMTTLRPHCRWCRSPEEHHNSGSPNFSFLWPWTSFTCIPQIPLCFSGQYITFLSKCEVKLGHMKPTLNVTKSNFSRLSQPSFMHLSLSSTTKISYRLPASPSPNASGSYTKFIRWETPLASPTLKVKLPILVPVSFTWLIGH